MISEIVNAVGGVGFLFVGMGLWRLDGIGIAFFWAAVTSAAYLFIAVRSLTGFAFVPRCAQVVALSCMVVSLAFLCAKHLPAQWQLCVGLLLASAAAMTCLLVLQRLLGVNALQLLRSRLSSRG